MNRLHIFFFILSFTIVFGWFSISAEAATLNNPGMTPNDSRVDGITEMQFSINFDDQDEDIGTVDIYVWFGGTSLTHSLSCIDCSGGDPDGTYTIVVGDLPVASSLVASVGSDHIEYGFVAECSNLEDDVAYPAPDATEDTGVRVNTIPVLSDDVEVTDDGQHPVDIYTLTITYTDADGHAGIVNALACDESDNCEEPFSLSKQSGDEPTGAVYGADFSTSFSSDFTVTVSASDGHDQAQDRAIVIEIDTETPWLKNPSVSLTSAGEDDEITFLVVYCVYDYEGTGTPTVSVSIGGNNKVMDYFDSTSVCSNGMVYHSKDTVSWSESSHSVIFSAFNDDATAEDISGPNISINDAPILNDGTAERHFDDANFVLNVSASDVNSDDGDTFKVYVTIEADSEREMTCDAAGDCTLTVAEADIIDQMGGTRSVSFRAQDDNWGYEFIDGFSQTIQVTRTSDFDWVAPSDGSFQPGLNGYDFEITNNGNSEDTFTVTATSDNGWVASGSESQTVTVGKDATETFTITMDVAHVAAGIVDHWSASITAGNDDTQTASHDGETTVAVVSGVSVTIEDSSGSALPGESVSYSFVITNTGNDEESFTYSTSSQNDWGLGGGVGSTATLVMGGSETVAVLHIVQEGVMAGDSDTINFDVGGGFPDGASRTATTTAEQFYGITINLENSNQPSTLNPGDYFALYYAVTNTGNGFDTVTVSFLGDWVSGTSNTNLSLDSGATGIATAFMTIPLETPSNSTSSILALVASNIDTGTTNTTSLYELKVNPQARLVSVSGTSSYIINEGESGEGFVKVNNEGTVTTTFMVTSISDSLNFANTSITLEAGSSGDMFFTIYANATEGASSFTIADTIDGFSYRFVLAVEARVFSTPIWNYNIDNCFDSNVICSFDLDGGWDGYRYTLAGTWSTNMTVTDIWGLYGNKTFNTTIANTAPLVPMLSVPIDTVAKSTQSFSFAVPTDTDGTITQYVIDFGDGNGVTFDRAYLDGRSAVAVDHTYATAGEYTVSATAYDNLGSSVTKHVEISVGDFTVTMDGNAINRHLGGLFLMLAFSIFVSVSSLSIHRSDVPEMLDEFEALLMEGIDNQEIRSAVKNLNSFQGIPMFSSSIDEYKELLSDSKELKSTIINKMVELGEIREEIYKMQDAGMSVKDLESVVHKLELQLAEQVEADTSVKYLETLQNKFVENQEFKE